MKARPDGQEAHLCRLLHRLFDGQVDRQARRPHFPMANRWRDTHATHAVDYGPN